MTSPQVPKGTAVSKQGFVTTANLKDGMGTPEWWTYGTCAF